MSRISRAIALPLFMVLTGLSLVSTHAYAAGGSDGGGGGAFVCRNADKSVKNTELLDLFEAREVSGLEIRKNEEKSVEVQIKEAIDFLTGIESDLGDRTREAWEFIKKNSTEGSPSLVILPPTDAFTKFAKKDCPLEGMMYFDDARKKLVIKHDIFDGQASKTEQAASMVHESLYKVFREYYSATDSRLTRQITGCLFTVNPQLCLNLKRVELPAKVRKIHCKNKEVDLVLYKISQKSKDDLSYKIIFTKVAGGTFGYEVSVPGSAGEYYPDFGKLSWETIRFFTNNVALIGLENLSLGINWETPDASDEPLLEYDGLEGSSLITKINVRPEFCKLVK
ncbi:MAG: hypothetical protein ACXVBE_07225 [Bdellovibrionota bacterium]